MKLPLLIITTALSFQSLASTLDYDVTDLGRTKYISVQSSEDIRNYGITFYFNCDASSPYSMFKNYTSIEQVSAFSIEFSAVNNKNGKINIGKYKKDMKLPGDWDTYMKESQVILLMGKNEVIKKTIPLDGVYYRYNRYIKDDCLKEYERGIQEKKDMEERDSVTYKIKNLFG